MTNLFDFGITAVHRQRSGYDAIHVVGYALPLLYNPTVGDGAPPVSPECGAAEHARCRPPYLANGYPCECECHAEGEEVEPEKSYRNLGFRAAVDPPYAISLRCDHCRVRWLGCADVADCPECGALKVYDTGSDDFGRCLCAVCRPPAACTCPRGPLPYFHGDSRTAVALDCPEHGWKLTPEHAALMQAAEPPATLLLEAPKVGAAEPTLPLDCAACNSPDSVNNPYGLYGNPYRDPEELRMPPFFEDEEDE